MEGGKLRIVPSGHFLASLESMKLSDKFVSSIWRGGDRLATPQCSPNPSLGLQLTVDQELMT